MTPRPILKTPSRSSLSECFPSPSTALPFKQLFSPHVHFPPTPTLSTVQITHSCTAYDRAPIVVSPNACALPERGDRIYTPQSPTSSSPTTTEGNYLHPLSPEVCGPKHLDQPLPPLEPPLLIPDLSSSSSDSDESDVCGSPLGDGLAQNIPSYAHDTLCPVSQFSSREEIDRIAFSFLPRPPSPMKKRRKPERKETGWTLLQPDKSDEMISDTLSLEGCLGGF